VLASLALALSLSSPALVELYSSEGCSSCPPAEALLRELAAAPDVVALEFHVDYWNSLGWTDRFSSPAYSERQSRCAAWRGTEQVFTPEAVIDGRGGLVGSDAAGMAQGLARARGEAKVALALRVERASLTVQGDAVPAGTLWVAVTETGLASVVARGENRGETLRHGPVVRSYQELGPVAAGPLVRKVPLAIDPAWKRSKLRVVAVVQDPGTGRVLALGELRGL